MKAGGVRLVRVCDSRLGLAEAVAVRYGIDRAGDRIEDVLDDERVDAVLIALPDDQHVPVAMAALEQGKHVLVEKPLGLGASECRELAASVQRTELCLQVGAMKRHDPAIRFASEFIRDEIGEVRSFSIWYRVSSYRPDIEATLFLPPVLAAESASSAPYKTDRKRYYLATHGSHVFDLVRFLGNEPVSVQTQLAHDVDFYTWQGLMETSGGGLGQFEISVPVVGDWAEGAVVYGEGGSLSLRTHFPFFRRPSDVRAFSARGREWSAPLCFDSDPYERQIEAFARSIAEGSAPSPDVMDGVRTVEIIEAVAASVETGTRMPV